MKVKTYKYLIDDYYYYYYYLEPRPVKQIRVDSPNNISFTTNNDQVPQIRSQNYEIISSFATDTIEAAARTPFITSEFANTPRRCALYQIISGYFRTTIQCEKVVNVIDSLGVENSITLNEIMEKIPSHSRPPKERRQIMLEELQNSGWVVVSKHKNNSFSIKLYNNTIN